MTEPGCPVPMPGAAPPSGAEPRPQLAALCFRRRRGRTEVLLVTSRDTGRWVLPKGWPMKGRGPAGAAAREAYEEAGVLGRVAEVPIGVYHYSKAMPDGSALTCRVEVFPLEVRHLLDDYPERRQRVRRWMSPARAADSVAEPELRALLEAFGAAEAEARRDGAAGGAGARG